VKALLMCRDRDFDPKQPAAWNAEDLRRDLQLDPLLRAMGREDEFLLGVARTVLLSGAVPDLDTIHFRQQVLQDCIRRPAVVRHIYDLAVGALADMRRDWWWGSSSQSSSVMAYSSVRVLGTLLHTLRELRGVAEREAPGFKSEGFTRFFGMLMAELSDEYLATVQTHLTELTFRRGVLLGAELGRGNEGTNYALRRPRDKERPWLQRVLARGSRAFEVRLDPRDEAGAEIVSEIRQRGIGRVAVALAESVEHVLSFLSMLQTELAFYIGCLNLHERLASVGAPVVLPAPAPMGTRKNHFSGLYDACLALEVGSSVVGTTVDADGRSMLVVTGANQGGKSTFLRSIGLAQLMTHCGMFVAAESYAAELCPAVSTHFKREEDPRMKGGKFDEELARMSQIVDHLVPGTLVLFNESFGATNEREGSAIAGQVVRALFEKGMRVVFVTHLHEFARELFDSGLAEALFLRAERLDDGTRTFRQVPGKPLPTSHGADVYREVFGA